MSRQRPDRARPPADPAAAAWLPGGPAAAGAVPRAARLSGTVALAVLTVASAAGYYVLTGVASGSLDPITIATGQRLVGALLLIALSPVGRALGRDGAEPSSLAGRRRWLVLLSLTNVPLLACVVGGFVYSTATNAALIDRLDLPLALLAGRVLLGEPARRLDWILIGPLALGVLMVLEVRPARWEPHLLGDLMFLGATVLAVANAVLIRLTLHDVPPWRIARWNLTLSAVWFALLHAFLADRAVVGRLWRSPRDCALLAALGALVVVEMISYYGLLRRLSIWRLRCVLLFIPITTVAVERLRGAAPLSLAQALGLLIVIVSLLVMTVRRGGGAAGSPDASHRENCRSPA